MKDNSHQISPQPHLAGGSLNSIGQVINAANPLISLNGGTGVSNSFNITLAGPLTTVGAFSLTLTTTAITNVTFPPGTSTLVNTAVTTLSSLSSIGTITSGTWNGTIIAPAFGGTGIANSSTLTWTPSNNIIFRTTGPTDVTFPTSGTLATTGSNGITITNVISGSAAMTAAAAINIYIANFATLVTLTLPTTFSVGQVFKIIGAGAGGWTLAQNSVPTTQNITYQTANSTASTTPGTGGSLSSGLFNDCIELIATVANTTLTVSNSFGASIAGV